MPGYFPLPAKAAGLDFEIDMGIIRPEEFTYLTVGYDVCTDKLPQVTMDGKEPLSAVIIENTAERDVTGYYYERNWDFKKSDLLVRYLFRNFSTTGKIAIHVSDESEIRRVTYMDLTVNSEEI